MGSEETVEPLGLAGTTVVVIFGHSGRPLRPPRERDLQVEKHPIGRRQRPEDSTRSSSLEGHAHGRERAPLCTPLPPALARTARDSEAMRERLELHGQALRACP